MDATASAAAPEPGDGTRHDRASVVQAGGSSEAVPLLVDAARRAPLPAGSAAMVIAEYAASERRSSLAPLRAAVHEVRERSGPELPIWVVHTELPGNDVPTLFDELQADPDSYLSPAAGRTSWDRSPRMAPSTACASRSPRSSTARTGSGRTTGPPATPPNTRHAGRRSRGHRSSRPSPRRSSATTPMPDAPPSATRSPRG